MKMIGELDQSEVNALKEKHRGHRLFVTHIEPVLNKAYCFRVNLFVQDYYKILVCSNLPTAQNTYQSISEAIKYIKLHRDFLRTSASEHMSSERVQHSGRLSGAKVQKYLTKLYVCYPKLQDCFMGMGDYFLLDKSTAADRTRNEVMDGMHRLVAYGLVTDLKDDHFPISIYFGTDKTLQPDETRYHAVN